MVSPISLITWFFCCCCSRANLPSSFSCEEEKSYFFFVFLSSPKKPMFWEARIFAQAELQWPDTTTAIPRGIQHVNVCPEVSEPSRGRSRTCTPPGTLLTFTHLEKAEKSHAEGEQQGFFSQSTPCPWLQRGRTSPAALGSPGRRQQSSQCAGEYPFLWEGKHTTPHKEVEPNHAAHWPTQMGLPRRVSEGRRAKPDKTRRVTAAPPER